MTNGKKYKVHKQQKANFFNFDKGSYKSTYNLQFTQKVIKIDHN